MAPRIQEKCNIKKLFQVTIFVVVAVTSSKFKKSDQHTHDMTKIEGGHVDDRIGAVPGPDSVNRRVSGPGSMPGLAHLKWAICKRGL